MGAASGGRLMFGAGRRRHIDVGLGPIGYDGGMCQPSSSSLYRRHRFPREVIAQAVWLYFRFPLSLRMVEEMLAARLGAATYVPWTRSSSPSQAKNIGCGAPSIRTASSSMFSSKVVGIERRAALDAQAVEEDRACAARHDHGQAALHRRSKERHGIERRASPAQGAQQQGREFTPAHATTGADHEPVQIRPACTISQASKWRPLKSSLDVRSSFAARAFRIMAAVSGAATCTQPAQRRVNV